MGIQNGSALQQTARGTALIGAILTLVVGIIHLSTKKPKIIWPDGEFWDDYPNQHRWRLTLFSFMPDVLIDGWTAFFFGVYGIAAHMKNENSFLQASTKSFLHAAIFQLVTALFATGAYAGGIGMIFMTVPLIACLASSVAHFSDPGDASLGISFK